ncbi:MAG: glycoside hydrolase family 130 protein [Actinomycetota bacterium]|nr:glycoside hydrolase family 130 protein [Actinomycetota bacterium]
MALLNISRSKKNPIITPDDIKPIGDGFRVAGVFNCGVTRHGGEVLLLLRVAEEPINDDKSVIKVPILDLEHGRIAVKKFSKDGPSIDFRDPRFLRTISGNYLTSISHLRVARSKNGINFNIDKEPALFPENIYERFGIEDPRITLINGIYYITYVAVSDVTGITTCLATTSDFKEFKRHGVFFMPDNKDICIFPEKIGSRYYALTRPSSAEFMTKDMWISKSADLLSWGGHMRLMGPREKHWDSKRIGAGAVPFRIKEGWLEIYHGASEFDRYCLGAVLLDGKKPWRVLARSKEPLLKPEKDYELSGFLYSVVFSCGVLCEGGIVKIYYGAADRCMAYAEIKLDDILDRLLELR